MTDTPPAPPEDTMTGTPGTPGFDPRVFARETRLFAEAHAIENDHLEDRVVRLEEIIAARWPRSWLLRRRLAREIRASVAGYDADFGDFRARRSETVWQQIGDDPHWQRWFLAADELPPQRA